MAAGGRYGWLVALELHSCSPRGPLQSRGGGMRKYEVMLILPAEADDKVISSVTDRISQVLAQSGGQVVNVERWGKRRLAYEIVKQTEGFYLVVECQAEPESIKELDRVLALVDEVVRFKTVVRAA